MAGRQGPLQMTPERIAELREWPLLWSACIREAAETLATPEYILHLRLIEALDTLESAQRERDAAHALRNQLGEDASAERRRWEERLASATAERDDLARQLHEAEEGMAERNNEINEANAENELLNNGYRNAMAESARLREALEHAPIPFSESNITYEDWSMKYEDWNDKARDPSLAASPLSAAAAKVIAAAEALTGNVA